MCWSVFSVTHRDGVWTMSRFARFPISREQAPPTSPAEAERVAGRVGVDLEAVVRVEVLGLL
jgi:hypothetical protein